MFFPLFLTVVLMVITTVDARPKHSEQPILIIVSFDGFRADYMEKTNTPNFDAIAQNGVRAKWMQPSFPSLTFPNHQTIATGLFPETHGITANSFYDPAIGDCFTMNRTEPEWFDTGSTPLYILNEMAGEGRHSGAMMWVGSMSSYHNRTATHFRVFNGTVAWIDRVDTVLEWLTDDDKPANLIFLYFEEPDQIAHEYGPDSEQVKQQIVRADNITGYLISRLRDADLFDSVDLIVTSDHGFTYVPLENSQDLTGVVNRTYYRDFDGSPLINILPEPGFENVVYDAFKNASIGAHFNVYWREDIPEEFHYRNNARISPIVIITNENYSVEVTHYSYHLYGQHGFNNSLPTMRAFFLAQGPNFKNGYVAEPFRNVDIYPLASHLLGLQPAPNNGSFDDIRDMLKTPSVTLQRISHSRRKRNRLNGQM